MELISQQIWIWRLLFLWVVILNGCHGCWEQERIALLQLKASLNHPNGTSLPSWIQNTNCCQWKRVQCNANTGRVIKLELNYIRYSDNQGMYLNASMFLPFQELKILDLSLNGLVGWYDNQGSPCLTNLEVLDLSDNNLNNGILSSLGGLTSLKSLNLGSNNFNGSVQTKDLDALINLEKLVLSENQVNRFVAPKGSPWLTNLEVLDLSYNNLNNGILSSLGGLTSLKSLNLKGNNFNGSIQTKDLDALINLEELVLSENQVNRFVAPKDSPCLTNLEVLDLSYNNLNNGILSSLGGLTSLKSLDLTNTNISGSVQTKDLDALINLEELVLSENQVNRFLVPKGIKSLSKLKVLYLDRVICNNISILLRSMGAFSFLKTIYLRRYSSLRDKINAHDLHDLNNLEELLLDHSSVSNNFLQGVGFMFSLKALSLRGCQLNGTLHARGLCKLKNLQELDISDNQFQGLLPSCLGNLTSLRLLDLSYNQFTGYIASSPLTSLTRLEYLSLSYNHFHAPISFKLFSNHSKLKVILSDSIKLEVEPEFETWVPRFQLKVFSLSNCTFDELYLENNSIRPPNFLIHQNDLRFVDLSHNLFGGRLPTWLLKNNTRLEIIRLRNNSFTGPVGLLSRPNPHMLSFDISDNMVQGQIPLNMSFLFPNLVRLNLSRNVFNGYIPSCFGDMNSLQVLDMSNNQLAGGIPERLTIGCSSLWLLKLSNNSLQRIPKLFNLISLAFLYLDGNNFMGEIPNGFSNSRFLQVLDISKNNFSGKLPRWIGNMSGLIELAMFRNHLQGSIPKEFCKLDGLVFLGLSENNLSGSIPSCFNSTNTKYIHLSKNKLSGSLRQTIFNCSSLVTLDLSENDLTGNIPNWIGTLSSLSILLLKGNRFEGRIPIEICHLKKLSIIDLSQNNLFGPIPPCLSNSTFEAADDKFMVQSLQLLNQDSPWDLVTKFLNGTILKRDDEYSSLSELLYPLMDVVEQVEFTTKRRSDYYKGKILKLLSGIDLSCNQLTGEIPHQIGNLHNIQVLNLSHNNLTGSIPTTFSNLRVIESLDLSYNHLNGNIPSQLIELRWLAVFSVAHNNLSGMIPEQKGQFGTFEESSYKGNPFLCGPPLHNNCTTSGSPPPTIPNDEVEDGSFVDMNIFSVSFLVAYVTVLLSIATVLYINPYWRQAWFHVIEVGITSCYYFVLDNIPKKLISKNN